MTDTSYVKIAARPYILYTDASDVAVGAREDKKKEHQIWGLPLKVNNSGFLNWVSASPATGNYSGKYSHVSNKG